MASAVPPMGSTQARPNLLGQKPHWGEYLDYDVSNDPNLNTTVLGLPFRSPSSFWGSGHDGCRPFIRTIRRPCDKAVNNPTI